MLIGFQDQIDRLVEDDTFEVVCGRDGDHQALRQVAAIAFAAGASLDADTNRGLASVSFWDAFKKALQERIS